VSANQTVNAGAGQATATPAASNSETKTDSTPQTITVAQAMIDLQKAIADPNSTPQQIKEQVAIVRASKQKAKAEAEAAEKELLRLLTPEQEAVLVSLGVIE
jgi:hypothetical protein